MIFTPVREEKKQDQHVEPGKWALVMRVQGRPGLATMLCAVHVLRDHVGLAKTEAANAFGRALTEGSAIVKSCTKDVGETILDDINQCGYSDDPQFKITLEQV